MINDGTREVRNPLPRLALGSLLALILASCAARTLDPTEWATADGTFYRLVTKDDFRSRVSNSTWGNVAHGAEICTQVLPFEDDGNGAFRAVMNRDCSFWNKAVGPLSWLLRLAGLAFGVPVVAPVNQPDWYILQHEQLHFAITEVAARQLSAKVAELAPESRRPRVIQPVYESVIARLQERHAEFDAETSGTYAPRSLEKWVRVLERQMQRLCAEGPECRVRVPGGS